MKKLLLIIISLYLTSCNQNQITNVSINEEKGIEILEINPIHPIIGDEVKVIYKIDSKLKPTQVDIYLNDNYWGYSQIINDTINTIIPYGNNFWELKLNILMNGKKYSDSLIVQPYNEGCPTDGCVTWLSERIIDEINGNLPQPEYGDKWKVEINKDTVKLFKTLYISDDTGAYKSIKLLTNGNGNLPTFLNYQYIYNEGVGGSIKYLANTNIAYVKIQEWNLENEVSGIIYHKFDSTTDVWAIDYTTMFFIKF